MVDMLCKGTFGSQNETVLVWKLALVFIEILWNQWKRFGRMVEKIGNCIVLHHCIKISPTKCCNNLHRERFRYLCWLSQYDWMCSDALT